MQEQQAAVAAVEEELRQQEQEHARQAASARYRVVPQQHHKVLHLIRHGEGFHNVAGRKNHDNYKSWEFEDAHLTDFGWEQAKAVQQHIREHNIRTDVVIVSPLTRALETAVGCFGNHGPPLNGTPPLMLEVTEQPGVRSAHPAVGSEGCPPFVCYELCREHLGVHPCDRRLPVATKQQMFPAVDFSLLSDEEDVLWSPEHRETRSEIQARGRLFMEQVMARPETHIAIVSHSSFLHFMMTNFGLQGSCLVQGELHRWFENCELRTVVVADEQAADKQQDLGHFPGFAAAVKEGPSV